MSKIRQRVDETFQKHKIELSGEEISLIQDIMLVLDYRYPWQRLTAIGEINAQLEKLRKVAK
jgi:hypothetical protein